MPRYNRDDEDEEIYECECNTSNGVQILLILLVNLHI